MISQQEQPLFESYMWTPKVSRSGFSNSYLILWRSFCSCLAWAARMRLLDPRFLVVVPYSEKEPWTFRFWSVLVPASKRAKSGATFTRSSRNSQILILNTSSHGCRNCEILPVLLPSMVLGTAKWCLCYLIQQLYELWYTFLDYTFACAFHLIIFSYAEINFLHSP